LTSNVDVTWLLNTFLTVKEKLAVNHLFSADCALKCQVP